MASMKLISGSANQELAKEIANKLKAKLTGIEISKFKDGEIYVRIAESVRGSHVFVIQPTSSRVNENLMELLITIDALRRASADKITAVIPYYGYARQDRKAKSREPITAKLVANLIMKAGADRVLAVDLHSRQIQGFFDIPVDNLAAISAFADYVKKKKLKDIVVVSPDAGGAKRARALARQLDIETPIALIDKRRPKPNVVEKMRVVGDVGGKTAIIIDDMIDTGGTIAKAVDALKDKGVKDIYVCATHAVFSDPASRILQSSKAKEIVVTNTIAIPPEKKFAKLKEISLAGLIAEAIKSINQNKSLSRLFEYG